MPFLNDVLSSIMKKKNQRKEGREDGRERKRRRERKKKSYLMCSLLLMQNRKKFRLLKMMSLLN